MPLSSSAAARYGTAFLIEITNPYAPAGGAIDNTRLVNASDDAQGRFETVVGVAYDDANRRHVGPAVTGVLCYLLKRSGKSGQVMRDVCEDFEKELVDLLESEGAKARIVPETTSDLTPTTEVPAGQTVRPDFDIAEFNDVLPDASVD